MDQFVYKQRLRQMAYRSGRRQMPPMNDSQRRRRDSRLEFLQAAAMSIRPLDLTSQVINIAASSQFILVSFLQGLQSLDTMVVIPHMILSVILYIVAASTSCCAQTVFRTLDYNFTLAAVNTTLPNSNLTGAPLVLGNDSTCSGITFVRVIDI
jgi:hypothetical protein